MITNAYGQTDCELRKSTHNISVYVCNIADSKVKAVRAEFVIETTPSILVGHILDVNNYSKWNYNMIESRMVKQLAENEVIYYAEIHAPWPASNRDLISKIRITQDSVTKVMRFEMMSVPGLLPKRKGVVRIPRSEGNWIITPIAPNKLKVDYSFLVEAGGTLPSWLVNLIIADGPHQSFVNLVERIRSGVSVKRPGFISD